MQQLSLMPETQRHDSCSYGFFLDPENPSKDNYGYQVRCSCGWESSIRTASHKATAEHMIHYPYDDNGDYWGDECIEIWRAGLDN